MSDDISTEDALSWLLEDIGSSDGELKEILRKKYHIPITKIYEENQEEIKNHKLKKSPYLSCLKEARTWMKEHVQLSTQYSGDSIDMLVLLHIMHLPKILEYGNWKNRIQFADYAERIYGLKLREFVEDSFFMLDGKRNTHLTKICKKAFAYGKRKVFESETNNQLYGCKRESAPI